jgi:hypothetical protein
MGALDLVVVVLQRLPLGRLGDGGHAPFLSRRARAVERSVRGPTERFGT